MCVCTYDIKYINLCVCVCVYCVCGFAFSFWTYKNTAVEMLSMEDTLGHSKNGSNNDPFIY